MYTYSIAIYNDNEQWEYMCSVSHRAHLSAVLPHRPIGLRVGLWATILAWPLGPLVLRSYAGTVRDLLQLSND